MAISDDEQHGGVLDDELEAAAQRLALGRPDPVEPPAESTEDDDPATGVQTTAPVAGADDEVEAWEYDLGNDQKLRITRDQAKQYAEFEAFLASNPELAEAISGSITGTHKFVPAETPAPEASAAGSPVLDPLAPPDALDMNDPVQKAVWDRMAETQRKLDEATAALTRHEQVIQSQQMQTTESLIGKATESYQTAHKLTDEDMTEIQNVAARLNVLPALLSPIDPVSGLPRNVDPLQAMESAFDLAHWQIPRLRDAELVAVQQQTRNDGKRKAKLSSLGGSSGSVPRQQNTVPTNPQERRQAMLSEMTQMLNGNWIQPEDS